MNTYHAAPWSSPSPDNRRYRTTHHQRTKQRGERDSWTGEQRYLEYETTWEEIERWSVDSGRVPEPAWDSLEQCEEGYRRMELATQTRQRNRHERQLPQKIFGGHTGRLVESGDRPEPTPHAYRKKRSNGQAPCYAVKRMVSPVHAQSPVPVFPL